MQIAVIGLTTDIRRISGMLDITYRADAERKYSAMYYNNDDRFIMRTRNWNTHWTAATMRGLMDGFGDAHARESWIFLDAATTLKFLEEQ
jgi:hypothetical protein